MRSFIAFLPLLATAASAGVVTVDDDNPADFSNIQDAIDSTSSGDVLLVRPGTYAGFVLDGSGRTLIGREAMIGGAVQVRNLPLGENVVMTGFTIEVPMTWTVPYDALLVDQCSGAVRLQDLELVGAPGHGDDYQSWSPGAGAWIEQSPDVSFSDCHLEGGFDQGDSYGGLGAGNGLESTDSNVALYGCTLLGGEGGQGKTYPGGWGGHACVPAGTTGRLFAAGSTFRGGDGGDAMDMQTCQDPLPAPGGDGGSGLLQGYVEIEVLDCSFQGGAGGQGGYDTCTGWTAQDGKPGNPIEIVGSATLTNHPGSLSRLSIGPSAGAGVPTPIRVDGTWGDSVELAWDARTRWDFDPALHGVWIPNVPSTGSLNLGQIPASGTLEVQVDLDLGGTAVAHPVFAQVLVTDGSGQKVLGSARSTLLTPHPMQRYCVAAPNSVGSGTPIDFSGQASLSANDFALRATAAPAKQFGFFFYGLQQQQQPLGNGFLCIAGQLFRFQPPVKSSASGNFSLVVDLTAPPAGGGAGWIAEGTTWNFQLWYRDPAGGGAGSNLSDAMALTFWP